MSIKRLSFSLCDTAGIIAAVAKRAPRRGYSMSLTSETEIAAVIRAVNQGIDSHLEACFIPDRGDRYERGERSFIATEDSKTGGWKKGDKVVHTVTLECKVSAESLPVLVRRLLEDTDPAHESPGGEGPMLLASTVADTLGIECI